MFRTTDAWHQMFVAAYPEGRGGVIYGEQIEEVRKELTGDTLAAVLKGLNEQLAAMGPERQKRAAAIEKMREQEITPIDRYLATTPASVLQQVAIPKAPGDHRGFITEKEGGHKIGVIEFAVGMTILFVRPSLGAYVASLWLLLVAANLVLGGHFDIAVRDAVLAVAAFSLAQLCAVEATAAERAPGVARVAVRA